MTPRISPATRLRFTASVRSNIVKAKVNSGVIATMSVQQTRRNVTRREQFGTKRDNVAKTRSQKEKPHAPQADCEKLPAAEQQDIECRRHHQMDNEQTTENRNVPISHHLREDVLQGPGVGQGEDGKRQYQLADAALRTPAARNTSPCIN